MATDYLKRELISHTRRVCALYKLMCINARYEHRHLFDARYEQLRIRRQFDLNKDIKDIRKAKAILEQAEKDFTENLHPEMIDYRGWHGFDKEGIVYDRQIWSPDYVMDAYHPLEKAQYPYFFSKREEMKDEYIKIWRKKMMKPIDKVETVRS